ncbi:flavin-containing monooxygenase [Ureibacillus chungkukjangi]|uniref:Putative flavoprotein involved in K+ transport n=1 Tax=Ureibacillus chungkukjangi TaxID=1202712 RepID=A0A318THT9_9BACL|nr:NAD(P)/FAD-dependent oxidoreductase [Ureibacillus chungkukjangi]MCM3390296.1 NAD(P)/FAD-dependent oxidoreductase [Ureibacillus chungkukjangi]PYF02648.1 putative flavoprotein involved in K+ transport [Ureibacillus chungkukjangi]
MKYDVVIIGAGQAGLSMGYFLKKSNLSFLLLDKSASIGESWKERYDSLTLFTPRSNSSLPGFKLDGIEKIYPTKDEMAEYLSTYTTKFSLPVKHNTAVYGLTKLDDTFKIMTNQGEFLAQNVVIATGPFQNPQIPQFSKTLSEDILQMHSSEYKNPKQLKNGSVLVVGGGNSGAQIAVELSKERDVYLSVGHKMRFIPMDIGNKSVFWYLDKLGLYRANVNSVIGRLVKKQSDPIFGFELKLLLKNGTIKLKPRTTSMENDAFKFEDGTKLKVENVIWSTGFKSDYSWIDISNVIDQNGFPFQERGVTPVKGLFFLGLPWQYSRGSALIQGVGFDAEYLFNYMIEQ